MPRTARIAPSALALCLAGSLVLTLALTLALAPAAEARSSGGEDAGGDESALVTPEGLADVLACRSRDAQQAFGDALFLLGNPPSWMTPVPDPDSGSGDGEKDEVSKATSGMIGLYGYKLAHPVPFFGEEVDTVYFLKDWVVALLPRDKAEALIRSQSLKRAPIEVSEQYYRFVDPDTGPMLGAFAPMGGALAAMLARAFGGEAPPEPPASMLFVGCNYTPASEADFLEAAAHAEEIMNGAASDIGEGMKDKAPAH